MCYEEAVLALSARLSVLPPRPDGSKAPLAEPLPKSCTHPDCVADRENGKRTGWRHRQHRRAGQSFMERWFLDEHRMGIGFVCGMISGGLLLFEFEARAVEDGTFADFLDLAEEAGLGDLVAAIREGYEDESPSGGIHWLVFCDDPRSERLASTMEGNNWSPLIETKGEGGYAIAAPTSGSVHPSGRPWRRLQGGIDTIVYLTPEELDAILALARRFDQKPVPEVKPPSRGSTKAGSRPGDAFNERAESGEVLEPHGWKFLFVDSRGWQQWCRPGKDPIGTSATITPDGQLLYMFTTSTPFDANKAYSKFAAFALLNHSDDNGEIDWKAAVRDLAGLDSGPISSARSEVVTVRLSEVEPEQVEFIWEGRIPRGKLTLMSGDPGQGKTAVAFDLTGRLSSGKKMPMSRTRNEPMPVIIMTAEDGLADTVVPRLRAAGGDLDHIEAIIARKGKDGYETPISFPEDVDALREVIQRMKAKVVIIDPLNAFLTGKVDSHRDHHVRRALHPLTMLAEETGVSLLILCHLNKSSGGTPLYRIGGSIGVAAAARTALLVGTDPEDEDRRILAVLKSNLAAFEQSLAFQLVDDPEYGAVRVKWEGFSDLTSADLLKPLRNDRNHGALDIAEAFLKGELTDGPVPANEIKSDAANLGISESTLQRAKRSLGVESERTGFGKSGVWVWHLPEQQVDAHDVEDP